MAQFQGYTGIVSAIETPQRKANGLIAEACKHDSITMIQQALEYVSEHAAELHFEKYITQSLRQAVQAGSTKLLLHLLSQGADIKTIFPRSVAWEWWQEIKTSEEQKSPGPILEVLDILLDHGWDINSMPPAEYNQTPLLWYVCSSHTLVQYCLDHEANLFIAGERTSIHSDDSDADIYHTERHALLLENAATYGDVETFELLKGLGAPLFPGKSWPLWHAPCILMKAVCQAAELAPVLNEDGSPAYSSRVRMVKHLLRIIGLPKNESDPRTSKIVHSGFAPSSRDYLPAVSEDIDLRELVGLLLDACQDSRPFMWLDIDSQSFETSIASVDFLKWKWPIPFRKAFMCWKQSHLNRSESSEAFSSSTELMSSGSTCAPLASVSAQFDKLSNETINLVALCLGDDDVRSLRRVNRRMRLASFPAFKAQFQCRQLLLTINALEDLHRVVKTNDHLLWHVKELVLSLEAGLDIDFQESGRIQDLLTRFFASSKNHGHLRSLVLHQGYNALVCVLSALQHSELPLEGLSLFPEGSNKTVPIEQFQNFTGMDDLSPAFCQLRKFTWTLSTIKSSKEQDSLSENIAITNKMLGMMPMLRSLELGWFRRPPKKSEVFLLDSCLDGLLAMTYLREIQLRGLLISLPILHKLVSETTATRISLIYITFGPAGNFQAVLDVLTSGRFHYFHLDDLNAYGRGNSVIRFVAPGFGRYPTDGNCSGPEFITREGNEARQHLEFNIDTGRKLASGAGQRFSMRRIQMYGHR